MTGRRLAFLLAAVVITVAAATAIITYSIAINNSRSVGEIYIAGEEYDRLMKYFEMDDVATEIENAYYQDADGEAMLVGALEGMVESLGDGYSHFYDEEDYKYFDERSEGSYIGLGMMLEKDEETGYARVSRVFADTPAYDSNILVGDLIAEIDGRDTREIDIDNAVSRLRGQDGTEVTLKIISSDTILDTTIVRRTTEMQVVFSDMINATTGYIDVAEFSGTSTEDFRAALETVIEEGAEQLIIDVRGTPGGYISQVADICDMLLLRRGRMLYCRRRRGRKYLDGYNRNSFGISPSSSWWMNARRGVAEIFAAAIQETSGGRLPAREPWARAWSFRWCLLASQGTE